MQARHRLHALALVRARRAAGAALLLALSCAGPAWAQAASEAEALHALNRLGFGPAPGDLAHVTQVGVARYVDEQLHPERLPLPPELARQLAELPMTTASQRDLILRFREAAAAARQAKQDAGKDDDAQATRRALYRQVAVESGEARLWNAARSPRQLQERMVDFWFNHFNVSAEKNRTRWMISAYERDAIRPFVFGKFRELLGATAHHPAMLWYLDNWMSVRDGFEMPRRRKKPPKNMPTGLNENYARELLELHTVGVNAGYTQDDVREAARALSGWSLNVKPKQGEFGTFAFHPEAHDSGPKEVFGLNLSAGGGMDDGERLLDFLAWHPATAQHLARKLCIRFVSDDPPQQLVDEVAAVFTRTDGDLRETVKAIFTSKYFWSDEALAAKTKTPLEFVASSVRAIGTLDEVQPPLTKALEQLGEPLYRCNPPTGFAEHAAPWVSAGALVNRINFGLALSSNRIRGVTVSLPITLEEIGLQVLGQPLSEPTRAVVMRALSTEEVYGELRPIQPSKAAGLLLGSPEFQRQ